MRATATTFETRVQWLDAWQPREIDWRESGAGDLAFTLEALQVSPDGFERVLQLTDGVSRCEAPAALTDVSPGYRIGAARLEEASRFSGQPIGVYAGCAILVWTKTEADYRSGRRAIGGSAPP